MLDQVQLKALAIELAASVPPLPPATERHFEAVVQSPRARALRRVTEITTARGWQLEVTRTLDRHHVSFVEDLSDEAVLALRDRLEYFEDCLQCACDPDDAPPAR